MGAGDEITASGPEGTELALCLGKALPVPAGSSSAAGLRGQRRIATRGGKRLRILQMHPPLGSLVPL